MPYPTNSSLPQAVKDKIKSPKRRRQWRHVWNSEYERHGDESRAFAGAWSVVQKSGDRVDKASANYTSHPVGGERCGDCTMFLPPDGCTAVKGSISPNGHCKFFEAKAMKIAKAAMAADQENFSFFLPLTKVEKNKDGSVTVAGYASTPALDLDGEIVSLDAVKAALPGYWEWRNIREMHQPSAVGVAKEANIDEKGLFLTSKITDAVAAQKCLDGVYKGYSVGGRKLAKDGNVITKIDLIEISVVDRPANPECRIDIAKSAKVPDAQAFLVKARVPKAERDQTKILKKAVNLANGVTEFLLAKDGPPAVRDGFSLPAKKADGPAACKMHNVVGCSICGDAEKRDVSSKERKDLASQGKALPGGGFPIKNKGDLANARQAVGRAKNPGKARALIRRRAKELGVELPAKWKKSFAKALISAAEDQFLELRKAVPSGSASPAFLTLGADEEGRSGAPSPWGSKVASGHGRGLGEVGPQDLNKRMSAAGSLSYCFDSLRDAQRSLMMEAQSEGGDKKDAELAKRIGTLAKELAAIIGQKAEHEGEEALDFSDADDRWLNLDEGKGSKMAKAKNFDETRVTDPLAKMILDVVKAGKAPTRFQRMNMARGNLKKARRAVGDMQECVKAAHGLLKGAYLAKQALIKAGKKKPDDGDADDMDVMGKVMSELNKAFGAAGSAKDFLKASNVQLKKAASRSGQAGQQPSDSEGSYYTPPAGIKNMSPADLATAGPGGDSSGSEPPILGMEQPFPGKMAKKYSKYVSPEHAEAMARAAAAEAKVDILSKLPAGPINGRRPMAFDTSRLTAGTDDEGLFKGVNLSKMNSSDENAHVGEVAKVIGNMITGGKGKSVFDPAFHGTAGAA